MNVYHHSGDLGDIVASFPVMRELGDGKLIISGKHYPPGKGPRESLRGARFASLQPLWEATTYLTGIEWQEKAEGVTHDVGAFRMAAPWHAGETLTQWQARAMKVVLSHPPEPWLKVDAPFHGKIIINRTARYNTHYFPWEALCEEHQDNVVFIGLPAEYERFQVAKAKVEYVKTDNLLEAAKLIAGSSLYIGNQSVLFWIAAGMGQPLIQETFHQLYNRDSIIPRDNAMFLENMTDLAAIHAKLELPPPVTHKVIKFKTAPRVNMSTSAGDVRKNLSTSAEIYTLLKEPDIENTISRTRTAQGSIAKSPTKAQGSTG